MNRKQLQHDQTQTMGRDLSRAPLMIGGFVWVIATLLYFTTTGTEPITRHGPFVFGQNTRVGSIVFTPLIGDICKHSGFDNDSGAIFPLSAFSCEKLFALMDENTKAATKGSHFATIRDDFRK